MRLARFILSSLALLVGGAILLMSLAAANNKVLSAGGDYHEASRKQFYLGQEILPDHVAYPVLMAVDRIKLETSGKSERVYLELDYAQHRFTAANSLLEENKPELALTTLTKAQKYLLQACVEAQDSTIPDNLKVFTIKTVDYYDQVIGDVSGQFSDSDREVIEHQTQSLKVLRDQLETQITQS